MEKHTIDALSNVAIEAIKIIGPAAVAAFATYKVARSQFDIEKIRLHDKDRVSAYRRLYVFARNLEKDTFPLSERKEKHFLDMMRSSSYRKIQLDAVYFTDEISNILEELEDNFICSTRGELIFDTEEEVSKFHAYPVAP